MMIDKEEWTEEQITEFLKKGGYKEIEAARKWT